MSGERRAAKLARRNARKRRARDAAQQAAVDRRLDLALREGRVSLTPKGREAIARWDAEHETGDAA